MLFIMFHGIKSKGCDLQDKLFKLRFCLPQILESDQHQRLSIKAVRTFDLSSLKHFLNPFTSFGVLSGTPPPPPPITPHSLYNNSPYACLRQTS